MPKIIDGLSAPDSEVWDRREKESEPAWQAFTTYRDQDVGHRSLRKVAATLGKSGSLIHKWSHTHRWVMRVTAWDAEQDRIWQVELASQRRKMAERQMRTASVAQQKVASWIVNLNPDNLTATEAARWYEVAVKIERAAVGEPDLLHVSSNVETESLSPEETIARLSRLRAVLEESLSDHTLDEQSYDDDQ